MIVFSSSPLSSQRRVFKRDDLEAQLFMGKKNKWTKQILHIIKVIQNRNKTLQQNKERKHFFLNTMLLAIMGI